MIWLLKVFVKSRKQLTYRGSITPYITSAWIRSMKSNPRLSMSAVRKIVQIILHYLHLLAQHYLDRIKSFFSHLVAVSLLKWLQSSSYRATKSSTELWMLSRSPPMALQKSRASNQVFSCDRGPVKNWSPRREAITVKSEKCRAV